MAMLPAGRQAGQQQERRFENLVELVGDAKVERGGTEERPMAFVTVTVPNDRNPDRAERFRVSYFRDEALRALEFANSDVPLAITGYLNVRDDRRENRKVVGITGTAIEAAPEGLTARNFVRIGGNLGQDPEYLEPTDTKKAKAGISFAVGNDRFVKAVAFEGLADRVRAELAQGDGATFEGRLTNHTYKSSRSPSGQLTDLQVIANDFTLEHKKVHEKDYPGVVLSEPELRNGAKQTRLSFYYEVRREGEEPHRIGVVEFGPAAVAHAQIVKKGSELTVVGKEATHEHEGKERSEIVASAIALRERNVEQTAAIGGPADGQAVQYDATATALAVEELVSRFGAHVGENLDRGADLHSAVAVALGDAHAEVKALPNAELVSEARLQEAGRALVERTIAGDGVAPSLEQIEAPQPQRVALPEQAQDQDRPAEAARDLDAAAAYAQLAEDLAADLVASRTAELVSDGVPPFDAAAQALAQAEAEVPGLDAAGVAAAQAVATEQGEAFTQRAEERAAAMHETSIADAFEIVEGRLGQQMLEMQGQKDRADRLDVMDRMTETLHVKASLEVLRGRGVESLKHESEISRSDFAGAVDTIGRAASEAREALPQLAQEAAVQLDAGEMIRA